MQHESFAQGKMMPLEEVKRVAEEQIEQESEGDGRVSLENEPPAKKKKGDSLQEDIHVDFSSCYDELFDEQEDSPVIEEGEARAQRNVPFSVLAAELEGYMNMPSIERNENPFIWWKQHESSFPRISQLAKQYLSMPASSVHSERLFSEAGDIFEEKRSRLLPRNGEMLLFLHQNLNRI